MRALGLQAIQAKKFKVTTDSTHAKPVAPDLIEQDFRAGAPNQKWTSDISYVWIDEGWLYLAVVMDLVWSKNSTSLFCKGSPPKPCTPLPDLLILHPNRNLIRP